MRESSRAPNPDEEDEETADEEPGDEADPPPSSEQVACRALALVALTARAILEQDNPLEDHLWRTHADLLKWAKAVGLDGEFVPAEREVLNRPLGRLAPQPQSDATWRLEGLVVLAWALRRFDLPPHDELAAPGPLWRSLGFLDTDAAGDLLARPDLRPRSEIGTLRNRLFAAPGRLRNFHIRPGAMDLAAFARTCWFGPLDLTSLPLADGDLAVQGLRLDRPSGDAVGAAHIAARERH